MVDSVHEGVRHLPLGHPRHTQVEGQELCCRYYVEHLRLISDSGSLQLSPCIAPLDISDPLLCMTAK